MPVSWCHFDTRDAPDGWDSTRDKKERVVFFKYIGRKLNITKLEFFHEVQPSNNYDDAMRKRDREVTE